ncbi:phosphatidylserine decarboxylase [Peribacillus loiseleuriae]|uniref:phosphatidylserine decarboxylase n=1 Tax=Peribacillus loiseleuriae TaxID=1679170 RepID=A0A0K9GW64_9BACI|nr:phosphatidylserine decarboxylase [Peribacillus loiseleuriae]KMY50878.1 phosphatidylserine decarboxylase [Peribacillus loiseleuriae]
MYQSLYRLFIELTNGRITSGALRKFSQSTKSRAVIPSYVKIFQINQQESEQNVTTYPTLHDLFTRRLKKGVRVIDTEPNSVVSPVDGVFSEYGLITEDKAIVVKGKTYSIEEMLDDAAVFVKYVGGSFAVLYLSPSHYHRIHAPISGDVTKRWIKGEKSYPVNRLGMQYGRAPLSKNYRNITEVQHHSSHVAVVKVGAMFVNSIVISDEANQLKKGQEFAYFSFGSTVVLLFEKGSFELQEDLIVPKEVKVGERIGTIMR